MDFESLNKQLEEIVKKLEDKNISIDEGLKLFQEGAQISKKCFSLLDDKKVKITQLKKELDEISKKVISE